MTNDALKFTSMSSRKKIILSVERYLGVDASLWNTSNMYSTNPAVVRKLRLRSRTQFLKKDWRTTAGAFLSLNKLHGDRLDNGGNCSTQWTLTRQ